MSIGKRHRLHILGPRTKLFLNPAGAVELLILIVSAPVHAVGWQEGGSRACEVSEMSLAVKAGTAKSGAQRMPAQVSKHCDDKEPTTARTHRDHHDQPYDDDHDIQETTANTMRRPNCFPPSTSFPDSGSCRDKAFPQYWCISGTWHPSFHFDAKQSSIK